MFLDHCHVGKVYDNQGHGVMVASSPSIYSTHAAPQKDTSTTMFPSKHHVFFFVLLTFVMPYSFEAISSKNIYLGLITPEYRVPAVFFFFSMGPGKL
ncbi:unnamed protein product [Staurois parvus]|uniref:Uncharacterized protein n=1 Tax=Staurois parvus TaxID=386267 RepID=A0ABN9H4E4_9NEOB|nr:unnamed protein product [Staurois parvus]